METANRKSKRYKELKAAYERGYNAGGKVSESQRRYRAVLKRLDETIKQGKGGW